MAVAMSGNWLSSGDQRVMRLVMSLRHWRTNARVASVKGRTMKSKRRRGDGYWWWMVLWQMLLARNPSSAKT